MDDLRNHHDTAHSGDIEAVLTRLRIPYCKIQLRDGGHQLMVDAAQLLQAVADEREACAKLAESMDDGSYYPPPPKDVGSAIRKRGQ